LNIMKAGCGASVLALIILLPAMFIQPSGIRNELLIVIKVFFSISTLSIFNHTTQWNHITGALRKLHIPGIFIFTLDITLKYIVLLGNLITDLLTSLQLRSVGKNNKKYSSIGGVMGVTFVRGTEMNQQMYEAMQCRGFTDDYSVKN
jgi:cobalt/nickel transport system permease protein